MSKEREDFLKSLKNDPFRFMVESAESRENLERAKETGENEKIEAAKKRIADSKAFARGQDNKTVNDESNHVFAALNGLGRDE